MPSAPTIMAATSVAYVRSEAGPLPVSPRNSSSDASPPRAIATAASSSERDRVKRSSKSPCARRPSACRRLMIDRTSSRRPLPTKYAAVACPASCVATALRSSRSEEHTSELQSRLHLVCRLLLEKKKKKARVGPQTTCDKEGLVAESLACANAAT